jgi:hypothetical protein
MIRGDSLAPAIFATMVDQPLGCSSSVRLVKEKAARTFVGAAFVNY